MKIEGSMDLESILLKNAKTGEERSLPIAGCFVAIGHEPDTRLVEGQVYLDSQGYIIAGENTHRACRNAGHQPHYQGHHHHAVESV